MRRNLLYRRRRPAFARSEDLGGGRRISRPTRRGCRGCRATQEQISNMPYAACPDSLLVTFISGGLLPLRCLKLVCSILSSRFVARSPAALQLLTVFRFSRRCEFLSWAPCKKRKDLDWLRVALPRWIKGGCFCIMYFVC